jgi:hypothetical protein
MNSHQSSFEAVEGLKAGAGVGTPINFFICSGNIISITLLENFLFGSGFAASSASISTTTATRDESGHFALAGSSGALCYRNKRIP